MYAGVDIGGTRLKVGFVTPEGRTRRVDVRETPRDLESFRNVLNLSIRDVTQDSSILGVGFACKGLVDPVTTKVEIVPGIFKFLEGQSLAEMIRSALPETTLFRADNDARASLAGELLWGRARGERDVLFLTLGTGIGGGILSSGKILRGAKGIAGHLGHITLDPHGPVCICGNHGCLETYFSARAIEGEAQAAVLRGCESALTERYANDRESLTCKDVFKFAAQGDLVASAICDRAIFWLAGGVAGLLHAFDSNLVLLSGQIASAGEILIQPLRKEVWKRSRRLLGRDVRIEVAALQELSGVIGAAALVKLAADSG